MTKINKNTYDSKKVANIQHVKEKNKHKTLFHNQELRQSLKNARLSAGTDYVAFQVFQFYQIRLQFNV